MTRSSCSVSVGGHIAAGIRHAAYEPFTRPLDLLGII
jgi:hypothetical protein